MSGELDAYYYGFRPTGVEHIDNILKAVAKAGKAYHHTEDWESGRDSVADRIQQAADNSAKYFISLPILKDLGDE